MIKRRIIRGLELMFDDSKDDKHLFEDTIILHGVSHYNKHIIEWYSKEYGLTREQTLNNIENFRHYKKQGELLRYT